MAQQEVRSRTRAGSRAGMDLGGTKTQPEPTREMITHAQAAHEANKKKNEASRAETKAKKVLSKLIAQVEGLSNFAITVAGKIVDVTWATGSKEVVDVTKLRKIVKDDNALFAILSVSKADVEAAYGSNVANGALTTGATDHKLTIKERK